MATETTNYGLTKPDPEDFYDVSIFNTNYDKIDAALAEAAKTGGGGIKVIPKGEDLPLPQRQEGYLYLKVLDSVEIELNNQIRVSSNMGVEVPETDVSGMKISPFMGLRIYEE